MKKVFTIIISLILIFGAALGIARRTNAPGIDNLIKQQQVTDGSLESYYNTGLELQSSEDYTTATFLAVGDIMLSRTVAKKMESNKNPFLPFQDMSSLLKTTDFNFGNLESPSSGSNQYMYESQFQFNTPPAYAVGLREYNFKLLNLANNHANDQGIKGLDYTRTLLDSLEIKHIGTGTSLEEAWQGQIITVKGIRIGFIGATYGLSAGSLAKGQYVARIQDVASLKNSIENLKQEVDFIVVTMHAGEEYTRPATKAQINFAHTAIDSGADIVIGAHPHWIQEIEDYHGKKIFYSLGNFIFDQGFSQDTKEGLTLKITLQSAKTNNPTTFNAASSDDLQGTRIPATIKQIELIPIIIENYSTPRLATETESEKILNKIGIKDKFLYP